MYRYGNADDVGVVVVVVELVFVVVVLVVVVLVVVVLVVVVLVLVVLVVQVEVVRRHLGAAPVQAVDEAVAICETRNPARTSKRNALLVNAALCIGGELAHPARLAQ